MGNLPSQPEESIFLHRKKRMSTTNKMGIILFGTGEGGKATIFKQLRQCYIGEFSKDQRMMYVNIIRGNIIKNMMHLVDALIKFEIKLHKESLLEYIDEIAAIDQEQLLNIRNVWSKDLAKKMLELWKDPAIQQVYLRRTDFQLDDNCRYYMENLHRIMEDGYCPTVKDIMYARVKTTGIVEINLEYKKVDFRFVLVGSQRNERKKWIHCFNTTNAILFVVALSEFDQKCYEDDETNRTEESLLLWDEIINSRWFMDTPIYLIFNKKDVFLEKLHYTNLSVVPSFSVPNHLTVKIIPHPVKYQYEMTKKSSTTSLPSPKKVNGKFPKMDISNLPDDAILEIFFFLTTNELCSLSLVCKRFYEIASRDILWKNSVKKLQNVKKSFYGLDVNIDTKITGYRNYYISSGKFYHDSMDFLIKKFMERVPKHRYEEISQRIIVLSAINSEEVYEKFQIIFDDLIENMFDENVNNINTKRLL